MENVIEIRKLSKKFTLQHQKHKNLKTYVLSLLKGKNTTGEFWALKGVNLEIQKGETFGIIGANGSGKSTLLKLVAGILTPTIGEIKVDGIVAPLISLGVGFHHELSGRENVFLNASMFGLSRKETFDIYHDIVEFSQIGDFIDLPVKSYSSGMYVKLGFSIAIHVNPDILLVDEVLAVGDEKFRKKCMKKIQELQGQQKTILFVSHNMALIKKMCMRVCLLDKGQVINVGGPDEIIKEYHMILNQHENRK